jgi:hypothetical protein
MVIIVSYLVSIDNNDHVSYMVLTMSIMARSDLVGNSVLRLPYFSFLERLSYLLGHFCLSRKEKIGNLKTY